MISRFFIDRPIFATVLSDRHYADRRHRTHLSAQSRSIRGSRRRASPFRSAIPAPARRSSPTPLPRRSSSKSTASTGMLYMSSQMGNDGSYSLTVHVRHRHRSQHCAGHGAEPRHAGDAATADRGSESGHHDPQTDARHLDDRELHLAGRPLRRHLSEQLRDDLRQGRIAASRGRLGHHLSRASAITAFAFGSIRRSWRRGT